jgi:hypothetical protein
MLSPVEEKDRVSQGVSLNLNFSKPIVNHNVISGPISVPGSTPQLGGIKLPMTNGPFPVSYFSKIDDPIDNRLISFLKNTSK